MVSLGPTPHRVGVAVSTFNQAITRPLLDGVLEELQRLDVPEATVLEVEGALELPVAALALARSGCRAVVAVGAVIQGETDHYEIVSRESARGLARVSLMCGVPVGNAVLAVRKYEHAVERSRPGPGNKGREAARAAVLAARRLAGLNESAKL